MGTKKRKAARNRFWKPLENDVEFLQVCKGRENYPFKGFNDESFEEAMKWLRENIRPLIKKAMELHNSDELLIKYFVLNKTFKKYYPEVQKAREDIHLIWKGKPKIVKTGKKLDEVEERQAQAKIDELQKGKKQESARE